MSFLLGAGKESLSGEVTSELRRGQRMIASEGTAGAKALWWGHAGHFPEQVTDPQAERERGWLGMILKTAEGADVELGLSVSF